MPSSIPAVRAALVNVMNGLYQAPTLVLYGPSGADLPDEIVGLRGSKVPEIQRPVSTPTRIREEVVETEVGFSVWTEDATGEDDQRIYERAFTLLGLLADYFKTKPNETLGGACREALVTSYEDGGGVSTYFREDPDTPGEFIANGRLIELVAVVTSKARI